MTGRGYRILVVDDELPMCVGLSEVLSRDGYDVRFTDSPRRAMEMLNEAPADLLLTDLKMPGMDGMELMERARQAHPGLVVIMVTGFATVGSAVEAIKKGAYDYIPKPFQIDEVRITVERALDTRAMRAEIHSLRKELALIRSPIESFVGQSAPMAEVLHFVRRVAPATSNILITGETGTGKELVARAVHHLSPRRDKPFVAINCGALPDSLTESEMFGHARGSFTGAVQARPGYFEAADKGTLFLDEVGDVSTRMQGNLLRAIETGEFQRVGETAPRKVDVRILAATNRDLEKEIAAGRFREDLFFRLNVVQIQVPPLRERPDDILPLAEHFLSIFAREMKKSMTGISPEAADALRRHPWPGNVRELRNAVERSVLLANGPFLEGRDLPKAFQSKSTSPPPAKTAEIETLDTIERKQISAALERTGHNKNKAAEILGINRRTLYRKIERYGLS